MSKTARSPIGRLILIGQQAVDMAVAGKPCPLCGFRQGEHAPRCLVGEAMVQDPVVAAAAARSAKERIRG